MRKTFRTAALLAVVLGTSGFALPAQAQAQTSWLCSLSGDMLRLVCVAESPTGPEAAESAGAADASTAAPRLAPPATPAAPAAGALRPTAGQAGAGPTSVRGTRYPLDPDKVYTVELHAPAAEASWLAELARATMCYRTPDCSVVLAGLGDLWPGGAMQIAAR